MIFKEKFISSNESVLEFPTLTISGQINPFEIEEPSGYFPFEKAVKWARKLMLKKENDHYHQFYLEYYYPANDYYGNEIDAFYFVLKGSVPEVVYGEGIDETTIKPKRSG